LFGGINDLGQGVNAQVLIDDFTELAQKARAAGLFVIGATVMPCEGHDYFSEDLETRRQEINGWIRTTDLMDAVIDFDEITRDPAQPTSLLSQVDGGDGLHPSVAGYQIMADAIDLSLFEP
jgi:lysophospholipase L1-like esterase